MTDKQRFSSAGDSPEITPQQATSMKVQSALMRVWAKDTGETGLTQDEATFLFGVTQPPVSDLVRGKVNLFSEPKKHQLWRLVRINEQQVNTKIKELVRLDGLPPTEIASQGAQLPPLRAKLAQIHKRLEWLDSNIEDWEKHVGESRYLRWKMDNFRRGDVAIDKADDLQEAIEINDANERVDALIAAKMSCLTSVKRQAKTVSTAPLLSEGTPKDVEPDAGQLAAQPQATTPSPAPEPRAAPALIEQPAETKEQRQDRRLQDCENCGLVMPKSYLSRLPDGVGNVAVHEGVTRQAFSTDVKAALKRRENAKREGSTVHRI